MKRGLERILRGLDTQSVPWVLGYSGGKDSTAVLSLLLSALNTYGTPKFPIKAVYCDTGVEIPPARLFARRVLKRVAQSTRDIECKIAHPAVDDGFFVKVIGRGYPPPTNRFRWCTDKIRIRPVERLVRSFCFDKYELLLGARFGESGLRDRTLAKKIMTERGYYKSANKRALRNFLPIFDYNVNEVWETVIDHESFLGVPAAKLLGLYREASGECPLVMDPVAPPCGAARFGCWTCTVVSKDKTTESLVRHGYERLAPLNEFRDWLNVIRAREAWRWPVRRNGRAGLGPFRVAARRRILSRLRRAELKCGFTLIRVDEINRIKRYWQEDRNVEKQLGIVSS